MQDKEPFRLDSRLVGPLPIVNHFFARMGVDRLLECHMDQDRRRRISLAQMAGVVCRNVCVGREPVYGLKGWAASYEPGLVGLTDDQAEALNVKGHETFRPHGHETSGLVATEIPVRWPSEFRAFKLSRVTPDLVVA